MGAAEIRAGAVDGAYLTEGLTEAGAELKLADEALGTDCTEMISLVLLLPGDKRVQS